RREGWCLRKVVFLGRLLGRPAVPAQPLRIPPRIRDRRGRQAVPVFASVCLSQGGTERFGNWSGDAGTAHMAEGTPGAGAEAAIGEPGPHGEQESLVDLVAVAEPDVELELLTRCHEWACEPGPEVPQALTEEILRAVESVAPTCSAGPFGFAAFAGC